MVVLARDCGAGPAVLVIRGRSVAQALFVWPSLPAETARSSWADTSLSAASCSLRHRLARCTMRRSFSICFQGAPTPQARSKSSAGSTFADHSSRISSPSVFSPLAFPNRSRRHRQSDIGAACVDSHIAGIVVPPTRALNPVVLDGRELGVRSHRDARPENFLARLWSTERSLLCICQRWIDGPNIRSLVFGPMTQHDSSNHFIHPVGAPRAVAHVAVVAESDAEILRRFEPAVRRYCRSRTRSEADAEDAAQDTYMRFLRRSEKKIRSHEGWLITAASRACADINRRHQREEKHRSDVSVWDACFLKDDDERFSDRGANDPEKLTAEHLTVAALLRGLEPR